jgi:hypothetical protein
VKLLLLVVVQPGVTGIRLPTAVAIMAKLSGKTDEAVGRLTEIAADLPPGCTAGGDRGSMARPGCIGIMPGAKMLWNPD